MRRKALTDLNDWLLRKNRKPLILRGARQVGKSTLVRYFAEQSDLELIEVNLEKLKINSFDDEDINVEKIIQEIEYKTRKKLTLNSLLFIDEIQENPNAIKSLRYFYEEQPNLPVIAAGSLLEFVLNNHSFSMPVGRVEYYHLGPMNFEEYLIAIGDDDLVKNLQLSPLTTAELIFEKLLLHLREFYYIGGMPEAIKTYIETKSFLEVERVHQSIIETYKDDFPKYASKTDTINLGQLISSIPKHIGKKIKYSELLKDVKHAPTKRALSLLENAKIIHKCIHTNASGIPLAAQADETIFKLYFLDIGLLNYLYGTHVDDILNPTDETLLTNGVIAEQFVAQHLKYRTQRSAAEPLYYWLHEKKMNSAEIDFILQISHEIIPIEVKSGKSGSLKSLFYFMASKNKSTSIRFDLSKRKASQFSEEINTAIFDGFENKKVSFVLKNYPLFLINFINFNEK
jgi:hypothetical protein